MGEWEETRRSRGWDHLEPFCSIGLQEVAMVGKRGERFHSLFSCGRSWGNLWGGHRIVPSHIPPRSSGIGARVSENRAGGGGGGVGRAVEKAAPGERLTPAVPAGRGRSATGGGRGTGRWGTPAVHAGGRGRGSGTKRATHRATLATDEKSTFR
jgi:hypothetical protein